MLELPDFFDWLSDYFFSIYACWCCYSFIFNCCWKVFPQGIIGVPFGVRSLLKLKLLCMPVAFRPLFWLMSSLCFLPIMSLVSAVLEHESLFMRLPFPLMLMEFCLERWLPFRSWEIYDRLTQVLLPWPRGVKFPDCELFRSRMLEKLAVEVWLWLPFWSD